MASSSKDIAYTSQSTRERRVWCCSKL